MQTKLPNSFLSSLANQASRLSEHVRYRATLICFRDAVRVKAGMDGCDDDRVPIVDAEDNNDGANERDPLPGLSYRKERLGI